MDADLRELERALDANPLDLVLSRKLARVSHQVGWTHEGRTLEQWLDATLREVHGPHGYGPDDPRTLCPLGARVLPALLDALDGDSDVERWNACAYLAYLGTPARVAIPALLKVLQGDEPTAAHGARWALSRLGQPAHAPLLEALAAAPGHALVLDTLALMGPAALESVSRLEALVQASPDEAQSRFRQAVREIHSETSEDEADILGHVSWSFGTGPHDDRELFEWEVWRDQIGLSIALRESGNPRYVDWRPARAVAPPEIVVDHEGYEDELQYEIRSSDGGPLRAGELMFLLHNAAQTECDMTKCDHRFFEGLSCESEGEQPPHYYLCLGS